MLELVGLDARKICRRDFRTSFPAVSVRESAWRGRWRQIRLCFLLDEPFGALDPITRSNLQKEFAGLVKELNKTAVFVTHDLHEAMLLGTRICLMDKGRIVLCSSTPENFVESELPLARAFLETIKTSNFTQRRKER